MEKDNIILIGKKPFMNYVTAVLVQFREMQVVSLKARGKFISKAVDVSQAVIRSSPRKRLRVSELRIGSEVFQNKEREEVFVSTIEIIISSNIVKKEVKKNGKDN